MEKKRKREKNASNGADVENATLSLQGQQETEHKNASDLPTSSPVPFHPWQFTAQQQTAQSLPQNSISLPTQLQETQGSNQRGQAQPQQGQQMPFWPYSDFSAQPAPARPYFTLPPPGDSTYSSPQAGAASNAPYSYPHPGLWDLGAWYSQQHPPYLPGFGPAFPGFFGYAPPGNPSLHKGFIKPPQGLSQKHQKLWEVQSTENIQIWAALARAEAELAAQRGKIAQLEVDLKTLKTHQETPNEVTAAATQPAKRGRYRKPIAGTIPPEAIAPRPRGRRPASEKTLFGKGKESGVADKGKVATMKSPGVATSGNGPIDRPSPKIEENGATLSATIEGVDANRLRCLNASDGNTENGAHYDVSGKAAKNCGTGEEANGSKTASCRASSSDTLPTDKMTKTTWSQADGDGSQEEDDEENDDEDCVLAGVAAAKLLALDPAVANPEVRW